MILIPRAPYIKPKGFLNAVNKVVREGIPAYADSKRDPKVRGTPDWEKWWSEEIYKCVNGMQIGGVWIPGRFYYYLNFKQMSTIKGVVTPDMVDLHLELAYYIEYCKANGKNLLSGKGRRKGVSEAAETMVPDYGWRFTEGYKAGIAAGNKTYVNDFLSKWRFSDSRLPPELSVKKLVDNDDEIVSGYSIKDDHNNYVEKGTFNTIYARTMHMNPNMFKGLYLNDIVAEEIGEFEKFLEFYSASKDCLMSGNQQVGMMMAFGTGGNLNKGTKDFKKVWYDAESFNFVKFLIPASRFYYYGGATEANRQLPIDSELYKLYKPYELIGVEDIKMSEEAILKRRAAWLKQGNLKEYNEDLQNNPINETEIFRKTVLNNFDINKLNSIQARIDGYPHPKYTKYKLEWVKDSKGMIKMPLEVKAVVLGPLENQDECIWILDSEFPRKGIVNLYTAGLDSYDQDTAKASKSLGAMCIRIRHNTIQNALKSVPVAVISCRPRRKEMFYDLCFKASVFYDLRSNVLVDVAAAMVMQYFMDNGGWKYLADRPRKFESETSEQTHEKGVRLTNFSRPRMSGLMQADILDNGDGYEFPELVNQLGNFDEVEIGSDNDLADAFGLSLMQDVSCDIAPRDNNENPMPDRFNLPKFDASGRMITEESKILNIQQDNPLFGTLFGIERTE